MNPALHRLHPTPEPGASGEPVTIEAAYGVERPPSPADQDRPWIWVTMVTSLDGSVVVDGASGGLGNDNDRDILLALRRVADVLLVGAGTVRAEGYGPPSKPGQRIGVATNSGSVDLDSELFRSGAGFVLAPSSAEIDDDRVDVIRAGSDELDLAEAVVRIPDLVPGARRIQAEGGPSLNGSLLAGGLIDELCLTLSPRLVGGDGPRVTSRAPAVSAAFDVAHVLLDDDGYVFSRWVRRSAC